MSFQTLSKAVHDKLQSLATKKLFMSAASDLSSQYLAAFPEGTNPVYITNTEHDCSCCKNFINNLGKVVVINDDLSLDSVWNVSQPLPYPYDQVAATLHSALTASPILKPYYTAESRYGAESTKQLLQDGTVKTWNHFHGEVPASYVTPDSSIAGEQHANFLLLRRALEELAPEAVETVIDLIESNAIYRGAEYAKLVKSFQNLQGQYRALSSNHETFIWKLYQDTALCRIRNTAIGTLLVDLSEGMNLEAAVESFEKKVAPENYKRTTALITPAMVKLAVEKITNLGIEPQLHRRLATPADVSVQNLLWVNRPTTSQESQLTQTLMKLAKPSKPKTAPQGDEVSMVDFIKDVLPRASKVQVMFDHALVPNLVTLTCAKDRTETPTLFKWNNDFAWAYKGGLADSTIKQLVKAAGGATDAAMRISLAWHNADDLDLYLTNPRGAQTYHACRSNGGGVLDVDAHRMGYYRKSASEVLTPVENVVYHVLIDGTYTVSVMNYKRMETREQGFTVEVESDGILAQYSFDKNVDNDGFLKIEVENGTIAKITPAKGVHESRNGVDVWNVKTGTFVDVTSVMRSPNFWDGEVGNEHFFFTLAECKVSERVHGFFNEFLRPELAEHRKVFEHLADTYKCEHVGVEDQLSGIGFSTTKSAKATFLVTSEGGKKVYTVVV